MKKSPLSSTVGAPNAPTGKIEGAGENKLPPSFFEGLVPGSITGARVAEVVPNPHVDVLHDILWGRKPAKAAGGEDGANGANGGGGAAKVTENMVGTADGKVENQSVRT